MMDAKRSEEIAANRLKLITPLLDTALDKDKRQQMRTYHEGNTGARRFQKPWRNYLWQSDIKYGVFIDGKPTYMVCFLDDSTRMILHSEFYMTLDQKIVQDCFRKALMKYGAPDSVYFDNGKQYRTNWMQRACGKLGIRLLYCRPYAAASKGYVNLYVSVER